MIGTNAIRKKYAIVSIIKKIIIPIIQTKSGVKNGNHEIKISATTRIPISVNIHILDASFLLRVCSSYYFKSINL